MKLSNIANPLISVIMAVKNGEARIKMSIESLLNQTFKDFELIIINDGSTDNTLQLIKSFDDPRIRLFSQNNRGVAISANRGIALAKGSLIARQDHDDLSKPMRFEKQVFFLNENPDIYLLGTAAEITNERGFTGRYHMHPTEPKRLQLEILFDNPFVHSSIIFRREVIKEIGLYNPNKAVTPLDDYDFISRVCLRYPVANLPDPLVEYYEDSNSLTSDFRVNNSKKNLDLRLKKSNIMARNIENVLEGASKLKGRLRFFSMLYSQVPALSRGGNNLKDMQIILESIFRNLKLFDVPYLMKDIFELKADHINFCWYINPGVASRQELLWYRATLFFKRIQYYSHEKLMYGAYEVKSLLKAALSKLSRGIFNKRSD